MKEVLIATTNKDKYDAVSTIFKNTIFKENKYEISRMTKNIPEEQEVGDNVQRARNKALNAYKYFKDDYDFIVGLDDAIRVNGKLEPNIKKYLDKILYENYINDGDEYSFNRAYCIVDKKGKLYETTIDIPYIYHPLKDRMELKACTYPLSKVAYAIGYNKPISDLNKEEETEYYLKYVKKEIMNLNIK